MKTLNEIKGIIENHKKELAEKYHVSEIGIFGSYVRNEQNEKSDVDILVEFEIEIGLFTVSSLEIYLSDLLGMKVDVVRKRSIRKELKENILSGSVNL